MSTNNLLNLALAYNWMIWASIKFHYVRNCIFLALLLGFVEMRSQNSFQQVLTNQGASLKNITNLFKDSKGFLWIGTQEGLYRYDGNDFVGFYHDPIDSLSLPSSYITDIAEDNKGGIWVATLLGLSYFKQETHQFVRVYPGKKISGDPAIISLCASDDKIWFGLYWGIGSYEYATKEAKVYPLPEDNPMMRFKVKFPQVGAANKIQEWKKDELWIASGVGIHKFNTKKKKWNYYLYPSEGSDQLNDNLSLSLAIDGTNVWFGTWGGGLKRYDTTTKIFETFLFNNSNLPKGAKNIAKDISLAPAKGSLLISSLDRGLMLFDQQSKQFKALNENENLNALASATKTLVDHQGIVWAVTSAGLYKSDPYKNRFKQIEIPEKLFTNDFRAVGFFEEYPDKKNVLVQVVSNGLLSWSKETNEMKQVGQPVKTLLQEIYYAHFLSPDALFIGGRSGCGVLQLSTNQFKLLQTKDVKSPGGVVQVIDLGRKKAGLVSSRKGFVQYDSVTNKLTYLIDVADSTRGIAFSEALKVSDSTLLLASSLGLIKINLVNKKPEVVKVTSYSKFQVHCIVKSKENRIFLGTDYGLFTYEGKKINRMPIPPPYSFSIVTQIIADEKHIWMMTNRGLVKINCADFSVSQFTAEDGFRRDQLNDLGFIQLSDKTFLVGQIGGFCSFHPDSMMINQAPPKVLMTDFRTRLGDQFNTLPDSPISLSYNNNQFTFRFAGLNFAQPERNQFAHRLVGVSDQWIYTNTATYAGLRGGSYTLEIKAANNDGVWSAPIAFPIEVGKPYWETWWFRLLSLFAFLSFVYLIYLYRLKQKIKFFSMRNRISSDLHDDIGSALSSISIQSEVAKQQASNPGAMLQAMESIGEASRETLDQMNDIVWAINPRNDSFENLLSRMKIFANQLLVSKGIELTLSFPHENHVSLSLQQRKNLYLIFKESVNNTAKYSQATQVEITLKHQSKSISLRIADNGKGFDSTEAYEGNGLKNMKQRAEEVDGQFSITSQPGKGTCTELKFPTGYGS